MKCKKEIVDDCMLISTLFLASNDDVINSFINLNIISTIINIYRYHEPDLNAGGSVLNTCKILREVGQTGLLFCGAIGDDDDGKTIKELINHCRVGTW